MKENAVSASGDFKFDTRFTLEVALWYVGVECDFVGAGRDVSWQSGGLPRHVDVVAEPFLDDVSMVPDPVDVPVDVFDRFGAFFYAVFGFRMFFVKFSNLFVERD